MKRGCSGTDTIAGYKRDDGEGGRKNEARRLRAGTERELPLLLKGSECISSRLAAALFSVGVNDELCRLKCSRVGLVRANRILFIQRPK